MENMKASEGMKSLIIPDTVAHELWKTEKEYDPTIWLILDLYNTRFKRI